MFLRKDATKQLVIRVDELMRKTTINAKIALIKNFGLWYNWQTEVFLHNLSKNSNLYKERIRNDWGK